MSGHDFEKQVRQKLHDLKMPPSAKAWENIEENLHESKRRRTPLLWLPLLLLGLGAGGYFLFKPTGEGSKQQVAYTNDADKSAAQKPTQADKPINPLTNSSTAKEKSTHDKTLLNPVHTSINTQHLNAKDIDDNIVNLKPTTNVPRDNVQTNEEDQDADELKYVFNLSPELNLQSSTNNINLHNGQRLSDKFFSDIKRSPLNSIEKKSNKQSARKSGKWSFGVTGFAGVSAVNEGKFINFDRTQVDDVSYIPPFASPTFVAPYKPSAVRPGLGFSAGAFAMRKLNERFSLSVGLNYLQLNTRNKVGYEMNASQVVNTTRGYQFVYSYYTLERDQPAQYRNRYHFIEVPVELHTRIIRSAKIPVHLNTGISMSQLLESNSLHFDGTTGVYYKDDKLLNKTQVALRTGVSFSLMNKSSRPVWIGPSARYNVTKVLLKDVSDKKNFMSLGVDVKIFLKK